MTVQTLGKNLMVFHSSINLIGMYPNEDDGYGDEVDGDDDRNDGMNALVSRVRLTKHRIFNGLLVSTKISIKEYTSLLLQREQ
jgi:hypothetical protein